MKQALVGLFAGVLFSLGLSVAGMTLPSKVVGFLDLAGEWDPSLAFVMVSGVGVNFGLSRWVFRRSRPVFAPRFYLPTNKQVDRKLLLGSAIFGVGWGMGGYCPGPLVVGLSRPSSGTWIFAASMLFGMWLFRRYELWEGRQLELRTSVVAPGAPRST